jgi:hypothetical protein
MLYLIFIFKYTYNNIKPRGYSQTKVLRNKANQETNNKELAQSNQLQWLVWNPVHRADINCADDNL